MPVGDALTKMDRLTRLQVLFRHRPEGIRTSEVAEILGVSGRTARRYLFEMSESGLLPVEKSGWVWRLAEGARFDLLPVRLKLDEALALYLAARLLSAHSDKHNPHAVAAMIKLAGAMPPPVGEHIVRTAEAVAGRRRSPVYQEVLETLTRAWAERRQVRLTYRAPRTDRVSERVFDPYFIEPSFAGCACYVFGQDHSREAIRVFKLERIERIALLDTTFEVWADFDPYAYLANAWGVMGGEAVTEVRLRFSKDVAYRIRESDWPGVTGVADAPDGGCVMTLRVSHTLEMVPWIRGWGPDCEVLAPEDLRRRIAEDMRRAAEGYRGKIPC